MHICRHLNALQSCKIYIYIYISTILYNDGITLDKYIYIYMYAKYFDFILRSKIQNIRTEILRFRENYQPIGSIRKKSCPSPEISWQNNMT